MKIGIDGRWVGRPVGLGTLSRNLIQNLAKLDRKNHYIIYIRSVEDRRFIPEVENFEVRVIGKFPYPFAEQIVIPRLIHRDDLDFFHATLGTAPLGLSVPTVLTLADAMFAMPADLVPSRKSLYQRLGGWYRRFVAPMVYQRAKAVVTISETSKKDLLKYLGRRSVEVAYLAAGREFSPGKLSPEVRNKFSLPDKYLFALVGVDPRKNSRWIIEEYLKSNLETQLVLVGAIDGPTREIVNQPEAINRVIFLGRVSHDELIDLYRGATSFLFPSLYEAFGLPILEAMACGVPVVTIDRGSNKEISGDAALVATTSGAMFKYLGDLMNNQSLRKKLVTAGLTRVKEFSWEKTAEQYLSIYRKAAK